MRKAGETPKLLENTFTEYSVLNAKCPWTLTATIFVHPPRFRQAIFVYQISCNRRKRSFLRFLFLGQECSKRRTTMAASKHGGCVLVRTYREVVMYRTGTTVKLDGFRRDIFAPALIDEHLLLPVKTSPGRWVCYYVFEEARINYPKKRLDPGKTRIIADIAVQIRKALSAIVKANKMIGTPDAKKYLTKPLCTILSKTITCIK